MSDHETMHVSQARTGLLRIGSVWAAIGLAAVVWSLCAMTIDRGPSAHAAAHNARMLWPFWIASSACWLGLTLLWIALRRGREAWSGSSAAIVLLVAIGARAVVLVAHEPALSDDVFRYVFDGRNLAHGYSPYLTDPDDRLAALARGDGEHWPGERELLPLLAFPEITSPYLPLSQYVFAGLGVICEWGGWTSPGESARMFRCAFTLIEIAMMLAILGVLRRRGLSPWWLALYAWHPLAIDGFAASGHQDIVGVALMVAALACASHNHGQARGYVRTIWWSVALAGAVMVKPIAAIAGLMILRRQRLVTWMISIIVGASVCIALALPLGWHPSQPAYQAWKGTADWMAEKAAHFGGLYEPVLCVVRHAMPDGPEHKPGFNLEQEWLARKICMWTFTAIALVIFLRARDAWRSIAAALLTLTLCSTTCHPWYLLWAFALFPLANQSWTLWTYALTISWGYVVFITGKGHALGVEWTVAPWTVAIAYISVLIALCADVGAMLIRSRAAPQAVLAT